MSYPRNERRYKMKTLPTGTRIWIIAGIKDMRKSFNGLDEQIQTVLDEIRRKNRIQANTHRPARLSAILCSLVETAKANGWCNSTTRCRCLPNFIHSLPSVILDHSTLRHILTLINYAEHCVILTMLKTCYSKTKVLRCYT